MHKRFGPKFRPVVERLEGKLLLSAIIATTSRVVAPNQAAITASSKTPRYTLYRITNPTPFNAHLKPPFPQVLVQATQPKAGQIYNILFVSVRNGTRQTFDAQSGLKVRVTGQTRSFPVLTGDATWKPGQRFVFYVLTKKYYPIRPVVSAGFEFDLAGSRGVAIPGPSGIFLRVKYNPDGFARALNTIVATGPGSRGTTLGLPNTSIWEFVPSTVHIQPL